MLPILADNVISSDATLRLSAAQCTAALFDLAAARLASTHCKPSPPAYA
jgi:hypothetical protein